MADVMPWPGVSSQRSRPVRLTPKLARVPDPVARARLPGRDPLV